MERRRGFASEQTVHDAESGHATPVPQRLQLDAFRVAHDAHSSDLDPVETRKGRGWGPQPQGTAVLEL